VPVRAPEPESAGRKASDRDGSPGPAQKPAPRKKRPKTPLTAKQLREFTARLLAKRAELTGDMLNMTDEALNRNGGGGAETSSVPIHLAERGSDNWEQEFTLGLIANEKALVREIDEALERIQNRTYGVCLGTDQPISLARLEARPWAKYCIEYARLRDEGRAS
jgi:RNA polymerase-binding protein DksA